MGGNGRGNDQDLKNSSPHANPRGQGQDHTAYIWAWEEGAASPGVDRHSVFLEENCSPL